MKIIDFILSNWFIVVVLYVVLSTFLKRIRPSGGAHPRKPGRPPGKGMPPFGGGGEMSWPGRTAGGVTPPVTKAAPAKASADAAKAPAPAPAAAAPSGLRAAAAEAKRGESRPGRLQPRPEPAAAAADAGDHGAPLGPLTPQDALRGVVWAEILGPPRAKRPYRYK